MLIFHPWCRRIGCILQLYQASLFCKQFLSLEPLPEGGSPHNPCSISLNYIVQISMSASTVHQESNQGHPEPFNHESSALTSRPQLRLNKNSIVEPRAAHQLNTFTHKSYFQWKIHGLFNITTAKFVFRLHASRNK